MEGNGFINITTEEIGRFIFNYLIKEEGFCIDKDLQEAIAYGMFEFLISIGAVCEEYDYMDDCEGYDYD